MAFTFLKHIATGVKIYFITQILRDLRCDANMFIPVNSKLSRDINSAIKLLDKIKCRLDDHVCCENPTRSNAAVINVYYGLVRELQKAFQDEKS